MTEEIWKPVPGFETKYFISSRGRVKNALGHVLAECKHSQGYKMVFLALGRRHMRKPKTIHRLVAEAFIPNIQGKTDLNHKDGDKSNNRVENLEWCTRSENMLHAHKIGLCENQRKMPVIGISLLDGSEVWFESQIAAEIALSSTGRQSSAIHHCFIGKKKSAYGYVWRMA